MLPRAEWEASDLARDYAPPSLSSEGFVHCTDDPERLAWVGNQFYRAIPGDWIVLVLDRARIRPPVRYDDPERFFPHVCGPLNRDAILRVFALRRDADGAFLSTPDPGA